MPCPFHVKFLYFSSYLPNLLLNCTCFAEEKTPLATHIHIRKILYSYKLKPVRHGQYRPQTLSSSVSWYTLCPLQNAS